MASDIKITSLMAIGGVGSVTLTAYAASPLGMTCLPYMQASKIEFWVSNNNNRANATKLTESEVGVAVQGGLAANVTRYYWARAIDPEGNEGEFYPVSPTGGLSATTLTTAPGPNSVGPSELQNNAVQATHISNLAVTEGKIANLAVTNAKIQNMSADKLTAGSITATISITGPTVTGGVIRTAPTGNRVQVTGSTNTLDIWSGSLQIVRMGPSTNSEWQGTITAITTNSVGLSVASGASSGLPAAQIRKIISGRALTVEAEGTSSGSSAIFGRNSGSGGGTGHVGLSSGDSGYAFYSTSGGYGPFTGSHDAMILKGDPGEPGDIVFDRRVIQRKDWSDVLTEVGQTNEVGQRGVVGVIDSRVPFDPSSMLAAHEATRDHRTYRQKVNNTDLPQPGIMRRRWSEKYDRLKINALGEGQMNVCGRGGDLECGDLICASDLAGKGQRQHDDIVRSWTVAKARESVTFDHPDQVKIVAVILLCG